MQTKNPHLFISPTWCVMCKNEGESIDHLFFSPFSGKEPME